MFRVFRDLSLVGQMTSPFWKATSSVRPEPSDDSVWQGSRGVKSQGARTGPLNGLTPPRGELQRHARPDYFSDSTLLALRRVEDILLDIKGSIDEPNPRGWQIARYQMFSFKEKNYEPITIPDGWEPFAYSTSLGFPEVLLRRPVPKKPEGGQSLSLKAAEVTPLTGKAQTSAAELQSEPEPERSRWRNFFGS